MDACTSPRIPVQIHRSRGRRFSVTSFERSIATSQEYLLKSRVRSAILLYSARTISITFCAEFASNNPRKSLEKVLRARTTAFEKSRAIFQSNRQRQRSFFFYRSHFKQTISSWCLSIRIFRKRYLRKGTGEQLAMTLFIYLSRGENPLLPRIPWSHSFSQYVY